MRACFREICGLKAVFLDTSYISTPAWRVKYMMSRNGQPVRWESYENNSWRREKKPEKIVLRQDSNLWTLRYYFNALLARGCTVNSFRLITVYRRQQSRALRFQVVGNCALMREASENCHLLLKLGCSIHDIRTLGCDTNSYTNPNCRHNHD